MNPVRRLTVAGAGLIAGAAIVAVGIRLAWATATLTTSPVSVKGLPRVVLAGGKLSLDGPAVGVGYLFGLGLLLGLVPLGWLVAGPRARAALALIAIAIAATVLWQTASTRSHLVARARVVAIRDLLRPGSTIHISSGPGVPVTASGAALALVSAIAGGTVGGRAPRLGLPERPDRGVGA